MIIITIIIIIHTFVHRRRIVKSICVIKNMFMKAICSAKLLQISKIYSSNKVLLDKVAKNCRITVLLSVEDFSLTPLC